MRTLPLFAAALFAGFGLPTAAWLTGCASTQAPPRTASSTNPGTRAAQESQRRNFTLTFPVRDPNAVAASAEPVQEAPPPMAEPAAEASDPEPLALERQWEYEFVYDQGTVRVGRFRPLQYARPVVTARRLGRYAVELWIGRELVERVRFDFPLIGAEPVSTGVRHPLREAPSLLPGAQVSRVVLVPASPRATRALLRDRATGRTQALPWPPNAPLEAMGSSPAAAAPANSALPPGAGQTSPPPVPVRSAP